MWITGIKKESISCILHKNSKMLFGLLCCFYFLCVWISFVSWYEIIYGNIQHRWVLPLKGHTMSHLLQPYTSTPMLYLVLKGTSFREINLEFCKLQLGIKNGNQSNSMPVKFHDFCLILKMTRKMGKE